MVRLLARLLAGLIVVESVDVAALERHMEEMAEADRTGTLAA
jgi:hypothetical protein